MLATDVVLEAGKYAGAITAFLIALGVIFRWIIGPVLAKPVAQALKPEIETIVDERAAPILANQVTMSRDLSKVLAEVYPNGGRSMRDQINEHGRQLGALKEQIAADGEATRANTRERAAEISESRKD